VEVARMEVFAGLISVIVALIPMVIFIGIYLVILGLCAWVVIIFFKRQKERNEALQDIAEQLKNIQIVKKED